MPVSVSGLYIVFKRCSFPCLRTVWQNNKLFVGMNLTQGCAYFPVHTICFENKSPWTRYISENKHNPRFLSLYRSGTVNSKSFVGKVLLRIK